MLGFSEEAQGWLPCKITAVMDDKWQIEWWDGSQTDKIKDKKELPFLTSKERSEGGNGHWRMRMWEASAIEIWGTTRDFLISGVQGQGLSEVGQGRG